jgi:hypothetical protein
MLAVAVVQTIYILRWSAFKIKKDGHVIISILGAVQTGKLGGRTGATTVT